MTDTNSTTKKNYLETLAALKTRMGEQSLPLKKAATKRSQQELEIEEIRRHRQAVSEPSQEELTLGKAKEAYRLALDTGDITQISKSRVTLARAMAQETALYGRESATFFDVILKDLANTDPQLYRTYYELLNKLLPNSEVEALRNAEATVASATKQDQADPTGNNALRKALTDSIKNYQAAIAEKRTKDIDEARNQLASNLMEVSSLEGPHGAAEEWLNKHCTITTDRKLFDAYYNKLQDAVTPEKLASYPSSAALQNAMDKATEQPLVASLDAAWWDYFNAKEEGKSGEELFQLRDKLAALMVKDTNAHGNGSRAEELVRANALNHKDKALFNVYQNGLSHTILFSELTKINSYKVSQIEKRGTESPEKKLLPNSAEHQDYLAKEGIKPDGKWYAM